jgi:hypothetical protein
MLSFNHVLQQANIIEHLNLIKHRKKKVRLSLGVVAGILQK